ncbi:hypothetical protein SAMN02745150_01159 [Brevinema andersonii]|uniref:Uncharacterized protein n=1 Tax=Brevinema andersonii TaxID=34097 RepID=A0A1I1ES70_BREAD|nr:hypothetical protein [Brevinema andersonii]SFB87760.1 hypothetical protein SAMN02745150_01159 [Brevinema andersonii]
MPASEIEEYTSKLLKQKFVLLFQNKPLQADASNPIFSIIIYKLGGVLIFLSYAWYLWKTMKKLPV